MTMTMMTWYPPPDNGNPNTGPLFAISTSISTPDGVNFVINTTEELNETPDLRSEEGQTVEFENFALMFGPIGKGYVLFGEPNAVITRWDLNENDQLIEGESLSLVNEGVPFLSPATSLILDDERAFGFSFNEPVLVEFNPTTMTITEVTQYPEVLQEGYAFRQVKPILVGDDIFIPLDFINNEDRFGDQLEGFFVLKINIDTKERTLISTDMGITDGEIIGLAPNGDIFVFSHWDTAFTGIAEGDRQINDFVLRIPAGSDEFDPNYFESMAELTGVDRPMSPIVVLANGDVIMQVRKEDAPDWEEIFDGANYDFAIVKYPDYTEIEFLENVSPSPLSSSKTFIGDTFYLTSFNDDFSEGTYFEVLPNGSVSEILTFPSGQIVREVVQLRE